MYSELAADELLTQIKDFIVRHEAVIKQVGELIRKVGELQEQLNHVRNQVLELQTRK